MSKMFREIVASLVAVAVLVPLSGAAQRPPDLSGHWVLVTATTAVAPHDGKAWNAPSERRSSYDEQHGQRGRLQLWQRMYDRPEGANADG